MRRVLIVPALLLLGVSCGGEGENGGDASVELDDSLLDLLGVVPDTEAIRGDLLYYGNLSRLRDGDNPSSLEDDVELLDERSSHQASLPSVVARGSDLREFAEFTGFDTREINAFLDFGPAPDVVSVILGDIDVGDLEDGLRTSPGGEELVTETLDGVTYLSLGDEDGSDFRAASVIRRVGQPLRIAADGKTLYWARSRALIDACFAAGREAAASLADDAAYVSVATVLDGAAVVNAMLLTPPDGQAWTLAGVGETFQGETSTVTIALQYPDASHAAAAVGALGTMVETGQSDISGVRWSDVLTATDIHSEGSLMVATLSSLDPGITASIVLRRENLLNV